MVCTMPADALVPSGCDYLSLPWMPPGAEVLMGTSILRRGFNSVLFIHLLFLPLWKHVCWYICMYTYIIDSWYVVVQYNTVLFRARQCRDKGRILLELWTPNSHPIPRFHRRAWGCLLLHVCTKMTDISRVHYISLPVSNGRKWSKNLIIFWFGSLQNIFLSCVFSTIYLCLLNLHLWMCSKWTQGIAI